MVVINSVLVLLVVGVVMVLVMHFFSQNFVVNMVILDNVVHCFLQTLLVTNIPAKLLVIVDSCLSVGSYFHQKSRKNIFFAISQIKIITYL